MNLLFDYFRRHRTRPKPVVVPTYKTLDDISYSASLDEFMTRFQEMSRMYARELRDFRVVLSVRLKEWGVWSKPLLVDLGRPYVVSRSIVDGSTSFVFVAKDFVARETMMVDGMTIVDKNNRSPTRGLRAWTGGPVPMNPDDTLKPDYTLNAVG